MSWLPDTVFAYWQGLTLTRCLNQCRCWCNYMLSCAGIHRVTHQPTFVSVEPADWCMLHCPECPVGMRQEEHEHHLFSMEQLDTFLQANAKTLHTVIFYFQGEPLLNKALPAMIHLAKDYGLYTLLSTNGQILDCNMAQQLVAAGLDRIIISLDGLTQASYTAYRVGGSLERALQALRYLHDEKTKQHSKMVVELQCLRLRSNETEWDTLKQRYKSMGADRLTLKTAQLYDYTNGHPLMPTDLRYSRYKKDKDGHYVLRKKSRNRCYRLWSGCVIDADGNVLPCCFDKNKDHIWGNITRNSLREIWFGESAKQYREQVLRSRKQITICQNCTE